MARRLLGLLLLGTGCLDVNPKFVDPTTNGESDEMGPGPGPVTEGPGETTYDPPGETTDAPPGETDTDSIPPTTATTTTGVMMTTTTDTISSTSVESMCGDGNIDPGEQCDDGDDDDLDECNNMCMSIVCGDNAVQGTEQCDDGNANDNDDCLTTCMKATCGDGTLQFGVEECDDGNQTDFDGCQNGCIASPKLVFITSKNFTADLGGLDGADFRCQELAMAAGIPGEFLAWISSIEGSPLARMEPWPLAFALRDGTLVANSWNDLRDGKLLAPIAQTETGGKPLPAKGACKPSSVFTNTFPDGSPGFIMDDCGNWGVTQGPTLFGDSMSAEKAWTQDCNAIGCQAEAPIYCVQQ